MVSLPLLCASGGRPLTISSPPAYPISTAHPPAQTGARHATHWGSPPRGRPRGRGGTAPSSRDPPPRPPSRAGGSGGGSAAAVAASGAWAAGTRRSHFPAGHQSGHTRCRSGALKRARTDGRGSPSLLPARVSLPLSALTPPSFCPPIRHLRFSGSVVPPPGHRRAQTGGAVQVASGAACPQSRKVRGLFWPILPSRRRVGGRASLCRGRPPASPASRGGGAGGGSVGRGPGARPPSPWGRSLALGRRGRGQGGRYTLPRAPFWGGRGVCHHRRCRRRRRARRGRGGGCRCRPFPPCADGDLYWCRHPYCAIRLHHDLLG